MESLGGELIVERENESASLEKEEKGGEKRLTSRENGAFANEKGKHL